MGPTSLRSSHDIIHPIFTPFHHEHAKLKKTNRSQDDQPSDVIRKGIKGNTFLVPLSNTSEEPVTTFFETTVLTPATVHAAMWTAWMQFPIPDYYDSKPMTIDNICTRKRIRALNSTSRSFLRHDSDTPTPSTRLSARISHFMARAATKPPLHPVFKFYVAAQKLNPKYHKDSFHSFLQSKLAEQFKAFFDSSPLEPLTPPSPTTNLEVIIPENCWNVYTVHYEYAFT
ncbi:hypothetical protein CROQUDRAFT_111403 [Cronartium quercuum f. sp. fusiforme G11]|uniref:Uncharacterized protein n=1 Tax=Cronartium quercuum f. sp. fusiforme G11 TaxID=708437 RepID=A0A9P6N901_9BASI|nr:hypothetical protein CROQUDRAFT_111403 [Cronartium quercuum f. sp. fusiforme G11]